MSPLMGWSDGFPRSIRATLAVVLVGAAPSFAGEGSPGGGSSYSLGGNAWLSQSGGSSTGAGTAGKPGSGPIGGHGFGGAGAAGSGSNYIEYNPPIYFGYGPYGPFFYTYPVVVVGPGGYPPVPPTFVPPVPPTNAGRGGMMLPMPPRQPAVTRTSTTRRPNPERAREYVEFGDRSFRGDNTKRAEERYRVAAKADPKSATPLVRLAQVAIVRGRYAEAASFLREAVAAEPGFLLNSPDIQSVFSEPADFARELAELERHLQAEPTDRDAWFVLGAEWYLSGRTQKAADAFRRLTDRRPDLALAAFLDATSPRRSEPDGD